MSIDDPDGNKTIIEEVKEPSDLLTLVPESYSGLFIPKEEFLRIFEICGAYWVHNGDPKMPHALLTSGLHSNGYINLNEVLCYPRLTVLLAKLLYSKLLKETELPKAQWVVGSPMAAITFAYEMSRAAYAKHGVAERDENGKIVCKRFKISPGERVLIAEDLATTYKTTIELMEAIKENCPEAEIISPVALLVNRSGKDEVNGFKVSSLIKMDIQTWKPDECELCKNGSEVLRPKQNWPKLTSKA